MKISKITLLTQDVAKVKQFYHQILELPIVVDETDLVSFQVGRSILAYQYDDTYPQPIYHHAFNIPENQLAEAKAWLKSRVGLIDQNGMDEFDFVNWNAHSES